jgi:hypothetical protein
MIADAYEVWVFLGMKGFVKASGQRVTLAEYLSRSGQGRA